MLNKLFTYICPITYKNEYIELDKKYQQLNRDFKLKQALFTHLTFKLKGKGATIFDIKPDRFDRTSYICVVDKLNEQNQGEMIIFIMSELIVPNLKPCDINDMPHLIALFSSTGVKIQELHCDYAMRIVRKIGIWYYVN